MASPTGPAFVLLVAFTSLGLQYFEDLKVFFTGLP